MNEAGPPCFNLIPTQFRMTTLPALYSTASNRKKNCGIPITNCQYCRVLITVKVKLSPNYGIEITTIPLNFSCIIQYIYKFLKLIMETRSIYYVPPTPVQDVGHGGLIDGFIEARQSIDAIFLSKD